MEATLDQERNDAGAAGDARPAPDPEKVKGYHRAKRACHLGGIALGLAYWGVWLALAGGLVGWFDQHLDARWLGLLATAVVLYGGHHLVSLPLDYYSGFILERRYDLTNQTPGSWLMFQVKAWLVGAVIGGILLTGLYALLWYGGPLWSVWAWIGLMVFSVLLAKVFPLIILPLFYPSKPLERPTLVERLRTLADGAGMTITGIYNLELSKETKKANAMLAGLGSSRRVYLSDTLLEAFGDDQIVVVFAHELGHHIRGHIFKSIGLAAAATCLLVGLLHWRLNPFAGGDALEWTGAVTALAQVGFILTVFPLLIGPISNAVSRHFERQADTDALRLTDDPAAFRSAFELLTTMNLEDPTPPRWEEILFEDHPAISRRIAMADAYAARSGG